MRQVSPSVWVDQAMHDPTGVFCDVRYSNEARAIRENGGLLILVGRTVSINSVLNASEAHLRPIISWFLLNADGNCVKISDFRGNPELPNGALDFDWFVRNDSSLDALEILVDAILTDASITRYEEKHAQL